MQKIIAEEEATGMVGATTLPGQAASGHSRILPHGIIGWGDGLQPPV